MTPALGLALLLCPAAVEAIMPPAGVKRDADRFGLSELAPRPDEGDRRVDQAVGRFNANRRGGAGPAAVGAGPAAVGPAGFLPGRGRAPRETAGLFLDESRDLLQIDPSDLVLERENEVAGHKHVLYRQTYKGLPVEFSRVKVHLSEDGRVIGANSAFKPALELDTRPRIAQSAAVATVRAEIGRGTIEKGELVVMPDLKTREPRLAWKLTARGGGGLWRYYVDADDGEVLFRYNDLRHICLASGTVSGLVYDLDPLAGPAVARPFTDLHVYVVDGDAGFAVTSSTGFYCSDRKGKVFSQLQGNWANVSNFRGPSAHFDNGSGVWSTVATPVSSPHPYPNNAVLYSTINLQAVAPLAVKFLPVFTSFQVGSIVAGDFGESLDLEDNDQLQILNAADKPVGAFIGNRGSFRGTAVPGKLMRLRLRSNDTGQRAGFDVSLSSYLTLSNPTEYGTVRDWTWNPALHTHEGKRSELSVYHHVTKMHDFFANTSSVPAAGKFVNLPVQASAFAGPSLLNAFYDPEFDGLFFGDVSDLELSDAFTDDASVIRHEYTHFVVEKIWPIQNFGQAGAISEGVADYFSASSLDFGKIGRFVVQTVSGSPGELRDIDCSDDPANCFVVNGNRGWQGEIHDDSVFLSQALWDLRAQRLIDQGAGNAHQAKACVNGLVFQSLLFFPESFQEFLEAMRRVDSLGLVAQCAVGDAGCAGNPVNCVQADIDAKFAAHGIPLLGNTNDVYDSVQRRNDGFESAVDVSTLGAVSATIFPAGDVDFYSFASGPGELEIKLTLPASGAFFKAYQMTLYDRRQRVVTVESPPFNGFQTEGGFCNNSDCTSTEETATMKVRISEPGQFYLQVAGGTTFAGNSNSGVNSTTPYSLRFKFSRGAAFSGSIVSAQFDGDQIDVQVRTATFPHQQPLTFSYAQLRDHSEQVVPNTVTRVPAGVGDMLVMRSSSSAFGFINARLQLQPGFAARFPALGTVKVEVFAYNVQGSTFSLGLSPPINLTANRAEVAAFNNVFNPKRGQKTTIKYEMLNPGRVTIRLYTLSGQFIATLLDNDMPAGKGSLDWDGKNAANFVVASGVYLLQIDAPGVRKVRKIAVVK